MDSPKRRPFHEIRSQPSGEIEMELGSPELTLFPTPLSRPKCKPIRKTPQSQCGTPRRVQTPRTPLSPRPATSTPTPSVRTPRRTPKRSLEHDTEMISSLLRGPIKWDAITTLNTDSETITPEKENCIRAVQSLTLNSPFVPASPISTRSSSLTIKRPKQENLTPLNLGKRGRYSESLNELVSGSQQLQRVHATEDVCPADEEATTRESSVELESPERDQLPALGLRSFAHWNNVKFSPLSSTPSPFFQRSQSESALSIMQTMDKRDDLTLIGDCSRRFVLPIMVGKHADLKEISCQTLKALLDGDFKSSVQRFDLIDCRYPYEYDGGHIKGAVNLYTEKQLSEKYMEAKAALPVGSRAKDRHILIFHCEFSAERGPRMCRSLRDWDRNCNLSSFPALHYPEMYVLNGGYKGFHESVVSHCDPPKYIRMIDPQYSEDLKLCRNKSKTELMKPKSTSNLAALTSGRTGRQMSFKKLCI